MGLPRYFALVFLLGCPKGDSSTDAAGSAASSVAPVSSTLTLAPLDDTANAATATGTSAGGLAPMSPRGATTMTALKPLGSGVLPPIPSATTTPTATTTTAQTTVPTAGGAGQFRACCNALRKQAQQQPAQAAQLLQAAGMCDGLVAAVGNTGAAPQLEQLGPFLQGIPLPPVCQK